MIKPPKIIVIKSKTSELKKVEIFLKEAFEFYQIPKKNFNSVFLCISEAVVNSIEHGNNYDEEKNVSVEVACDKKEFIVTVSDEGKGFDMSALPDPTQKSNIKKESGRGIHIIKSYCETMEVVKNRSLIRFKMNCK